MDNEIHEIAFDHIEDLAPVDYKDDEVAFYTDIKKLPLKDGRVRTDMYVLLACIKGRMHLDKNAIPYTLKANELLVCRPTEIIDQIMISPDFEGCLLCLSQGLTFTRVSQSDLWNRAFYLLKNPHISISSENLRLLNLYGDLLQTKARMKRNPFHKEIIISIVRAVLYELLGGIDDSRMGLRTSTAPRQREVIFKRFLELLSGSAVKPRNVTWYAKQLCITSKHLSTVCKQVSGKTAFEIINDNVMRDIRYWLKNTDLSIKEIAFRLKFPSISFFGKYCRSHFGMSPMALRRTLHGPL